MLVNGIHLIPHDAVIQLVLKRDGILHGVGGLEVTRSEMHQPSHRGEVVGARHVNLVDSLSCDGIMHDCASGWVFFERLLRADEKVCYGLLADALPTT